jgi:glycosyltransferase involved in cell wall biosynthesis
LHLYTPATALRTALAAGLSPVRCRLLLRNFGTQTLDPRLQPKWRMPWLHRALAAVGKPLEVPTGLLELRATAGELPQRPRLSIIMPVYNEARTFRETFDRVAAWSLEGLDREIVIVESNSNDGSRELVRAVESRPGVRVLYQERPRGKGHAVREGLAVATGDIVLIQDADSEYEVDDYDILLEPLLRLSATFVLGSRHIGGRTWKIRQFAGQRSLALLMNLAHEFFTGLTNWVYSSRMIDPTTMYKVFRRECIDGIAWRRDRFDFDFELVCKLLRAGHTPLEVPINYRSRSFAEGKKVRFFRDPITWLRAIVGSRFEPLG